MNNRAYISASSNFFSGESEVKRRRLEVEERRLLLDEKAQVIQMVNVGVYTPRTARRRIDEIDQRMKRSTFEISPTLSSRTLSRSSSGSHSQRRMQSPSLDHHSISWDADNLEQLFDDDDDKFW